MGARRRRHRRRAIRCPKCGGAHLTLREDSIAHTYFDQHADGTVSSEGYHKHGSIIGVWARCESCQHDWKPRRVLTMVDVDGFPD